MFFLSTLTTRSTCGGASGARWRSRVKRHRPRPRTLPLRDLSLHAELAIDYFDLRSADAQRRLLADTVKAYQSALQLTEDRYNGGASPLSDVTQARTQLQAAQVQETDVAIQRAMYEHAIAVLIGKPPALFTLPPDPITVDSACDSRYPRHASIAVAGAPS